MFHVISSVSKQKPLPLYYTHVHVTLDAQIMQYENEGGNFNQKLLRNVFPLQTKSPQHLNIMCLCKRLPSPVRRGVKGLEMQTAQTVCRERCPTVKNIHFAISEVNPLLYEFASL